MSAKDLQTRAEAWLKARMKRLTPRQRLGLVTMLLLVYAALPVTRAFAAKADEKTVRYALIFWCVTGVFFPTLRALGHYCRKGACYL